MRFFLSDEIVVIHDPQQCWRYSRVGVGFQDLLLKLRECCLKGTVPFDQNGGIDAFSDDAGVMHPRCELLTDVAALFETHSVKKIKACLQWKGLLWSQTRWPFRDSMNGSKRVIQVKWR